MEQLSQFSPAINYWDKQSSPEAAPMWLDIHEKIWNELGSRPFRVLDLGAGHGNDVIPLLMKECLVSAVEQAPSRRQILSSAISPAGRSIVVIPQDIREVDIGEKFDLGVCSLVLHYFDRDTSINILEKTLRSIRPEGMILFRHFTGRGELNFSQKAFLPSEEQVINMFADWKLISQQKEVILTSEQHSSGNPKRQEMIEWLFKRKDVQSRPDQRQEYAYRETVDFILAEKRAFKEEVISLGFNQNGNAGSDF